MRQWRPTSLEFGGIGGIIGAVQSSLALPVFPCIRCCPMSSDKPKGEKDHPQSEAEQRTRGKESTKRHVYVEPGVKIDFVQDLRDKYDSSQTEDATHSKKILFWTQVSAVLLFIYAGLTAWQGSLTRESINNNSKQFQIDQRPYLWTTNRRPQITIVADQRMWANIELV